MITTTVRSLCLTFLLAVALISPTVLSAQQQSSAMSQDDCNGFRIMPIPDSIWNRMQGKTYIDNPHIKRADLRYLKVLHWDYDNRAHEGELICNQQIAAVLLDIFHQLYQAHYPIQRIQLPDHYDADDERQMRDNNTSCFCYRMVSGTQKLSKHSRGLAIDLNPLYNPCVRWDKNGKIRSVQPSTAMKYCDRSQSFRYRITKADLAYKLFTQHGFQWGGSWRSLKDYQHFEWEE